MSFEHEVFDRSFESLKQEFIRLQQHETMLGIEALHAVETLLKDLSKISVAYKQLRTNQRPQVEDPIRNLLRYTEETIERFQLEIDNLWKEEIEKLVGKHAINNLNKGEII